MVKTSTLLKKLSSYSALASVAMAAGQGAHGQVIYTDIKPDDTLLMKHSYLLDLNNDGVKDYKFEVTTFTENNGVSVRNLVEVFAYGTNAIENGSATSSNHVAKPLNYKSVIGSKVPWRTNQAGMGSCTNFFNSASGNVFAGKGDRYVGLKLKKGGNTYYGWVRVNVNTKCDEMIIKDYAYNATAGTSITAGQGKPAGIDVISGTVSGITYYPNPAANTISIHYNTSVEAAVTLELYDMAGRKLKTILNNALQQPGLNAIPDDVSTLSDGIYFYKLTVNGEIYTQKLVVAH